MPPVHGLPQPQQFAQNGQPLSKQGGNGYYDYSLSSGQLPNANSDIASAAAYTETAPKAGAYSNLGWHPTLERELGIPKSQREEGPRLHLQGQLANMKQMQAPRKPKHQPSIDPHQVNVAAVKLAKAQALLRKSVASGLRLHGTAAEKKRALGRNLDPCRSLECEKKRYAELKVKERKEKQAEDAIKAARGTSPQAKAQERLAAKHAASREAKVQAAAEQEKAKVDARAKKEALAGMPHHTVFAFPTPQPASPAPPERKVGPVSTMAMSILLAVFVGLVTMGLVVAGVHARRERKRNQLQAMDSFA